jgi:SnoaL-like domain
VIWYERGMSRSGVLAAVLTSALVVLPCCASEPKCAPVVPLEVAAAAAPLPVAPDGKGASPSTDDMTKAAATVDRFHAAAAAADEDTYFALFSEGGVFLGTDGKERWTVPQFRVYAHPRFASGKAWSFRAIHRDLSVHGDVVWFDEDLDTPNLGRARGSGVLVRDAKGEWKVAQYNLSIPIPNERFAEVKKIIEGGAAPPAATAPAGTGKVAPPPPGGKVDPPVCPLARSARTRGSPAAAALEQQCRAAGGIP